MIAIPVQAVPPVRGNLPSMEERNAAARAGLVDFFQAFEEGSPQFLEFLKGKDENGRTVAHESVGAGQFTVLIYLKENCPDLMQEKDSKGKTLAHEAALVGHPRVIHYLYENYQGLFAEKDLDGKTPFHYIARHGLAGFLDLSAASSLEIWKIQDKAKRTIAHEAVDAVQTQVIASLAGHLPSLFVEPDSTGMTPLHWIIQKAHYPLFRMVADQLSLDLLSRTYSQGRTLMHAAALNGNSRIFAYLLARSMDLGRQVDADGLTPLHLAAQNDQLGLFEALSRPKGREFLELLSQPDKANETVAHWALRGDSRNVLKHLTEKHSTLMEDGTAAHWAARADAVEMLQAFEKDSPSLMQRVDSQGRTIAHWAADAGALGVLQYLKDVYPDLMRQTDRCGKNIAHFAAEKDRLRLIEWIYSKDDLRHLFEETDLYGKMPIHSAAVKGSSNVLEYFMGVYPGVMDLKDTRTGLTALHWAMRSGQRDTLKMIMGRTFQRHLKGLDEQGRTIAHEAAEGGYLDILQDLEKSASELLVQSDKNGITPVHLAAGHMNPEIFGWFMKQADISGYLKLKDHQNRTVMHWAAEKGNPEIFESLFLRFLHNSSRAQTQSGKVGLSLLTQEDREGVTPLYLIGRRLDAEDLFKRIMKTGGYKRFRDVQDHRGRALIHFLAEGGSEGLLKECILEDFKLLGQQDKNGVTPLHLFARNGKTDGILNWLIQEQMKSKKQQETIQKVFTAKDYYGNSIAHWAAEGGAVHFLKTLKAKRPELLKQLGNGGITAVHWAAKSGNLPALQWFYENDLDFFQQLDSEGQTVAHWAARQGSAVVLRYLMTHAFDLFKKTDQKGKSPMRVAIDLDNVQFLNDLNEQDPREFLNFLEARDSQGRTIAHWSAEITGKQLKEGGIRKTAVLDYLWKFFPEFLEKSRIDQDLEGYNPDLIETLTEKNLGFHLEHAHLAAEQGNEDLLKSIIVAAPYLCEKQDNQGRTPAHVSVQKAQEGCLDVLMSLCGPAFLSIPDNRGKVVAHYVAQKGDTAHLEKILKKSLESTKVPDRRGMTPMDLAARSAHFSTWKLLQGGFTPTQIHRPVPQQKSAESSLAQNQGTPRYVDTYLYKPLMHGLTSFDEDNWDGLNLFNQWVLKKIGYSAHYVTKVGANTDYLKLAHRNDEKCYRKQNKAGLAPTYIAAQTRQLEIFKTIIKLDRDSLLITEPNSGWTVAHFAASSGYDDLIDALDESIPDKSFIGSLFEIKDKKGRTPAYLAIENGNLGVFEMISGQAPNSLSIADPTGKNPAHLAAENGKLDFLKVIIQKQRDSLGAETQFNRFTSAHLAAKNGHLNCLEEMYTAFPGLFEIKDRYSKVPLEYYPKI